MKKIKHIEWRRSTKEEIENGAPEMTKIREVISYYDSSGNEITEKEYKREMTMPKKVLRYLKTLL